MNKVIVKGLFLIVPVILIQVNNIEAEAAVRRVPADFPTIQQAINASANGDTVQVAPGVYFENLDFLGKAITVVSESGPAVTIIDGNQADTVIAFHSGEGRDSVLMGFTIRNGKAASISPSNLRGGGIRTDASSPTIKNNVITGNFAVLDGGGISATGGAPLIQQNSITTNGGCTGSGISLRFSSAVVQSNLIDGNFHFGCIGGQGGGLFIGGESAAQVLDNTISNNSHTSGAAIQLFASGAALVQGNRIKGNNATTFGSIIDVANSSPSRIVQNLIVDNIGTAIAWSSQVDAIINNTIANNDGARSSGILAEAGTFQGRPRIFNNIIVAKPGQSAIVCDIEAPFSLALGFNNVFSPQGLAYAGSCSDQMGLNGNISADPLFVNESIGDYHLRIGSASVDTGDNSAPSLPSNDLDGRPRISDGNGDGINRIDMGAFELPPLFDMCIQDDSTSTILRANTVTGDYHIDNCWGFTLSGRGSFVKKGGLVTLQDNQGDRRVLARIDTKLNKAVASIQVFSLGMTIVLTDRNTTNNTCACPAR